MSVMRRTTACLVNRPLPARPPALQNGPKHPEVLAPCPLQRCQEEIRTLPLYYIPADRLAQPLLVGDHIEKIVLELEGAPQVVPEAAKRFQVLPAAAAQHPSHFARQREQATGLQFDHRKVVAHAYVFPAPELEVHRLAFAHVQKAARE